MCKPGALAVIPWGSSWFWRRVGASTTGSNSLASVVMVLLSRLRERHLRKNSFKSALAWAPWMSYLLRQSGADQRCPPLHARLQSLRTSCSRGVRSQRHILYGDDHAQQQPAGLILRSMSCQPQRFRNICCKSVIRCTCPVLKAVIKAAFKWDFRPDFLKDTP